MPKEVDAFLNKWGKLCKGNTVKRDDIILLVRKYKEAKQVCSTAHACIAFCPSRAACG